MTVKHLLSVTFASGAIVLFVAATVGVPSFGPRETTNTPGVFFSGERLQYEVSWLFFRLGTIVVTTERVDDGSSPEKYRARIRLDSNPAIFFVSVHNTYESIISTSPVRCVQFTAWEELGDDTLVTEYRIVDTARKVDIIQWHTLSRDTVRHSTIEDVSQVYEGASLFFLARSNLHSRDTLRAPTLVDTDLFMTDIYFNQSVVPKYFDAIDADVATKELYGNANFVEKSIGGFSGAFRGWFTIDEAAIPIYAEMNLTLGTADVELEQWSRGSWNPPPAPPTR